MNLFDVVLILIIATGVINGYRKGFLFMLFAVAALVLGVLAGIFLMGEITATLRPHLAISDKWLPFLSFLLVFAVTLIVVRTAGAITSWALHKTIFGTPDKLLGAVLGAVKSAIWLGLIIWLADSILTNIPWWMEESFIYDVLGKGFIHVLPV